ncbi:MAG: patatin-like phospholipase family protein, partial [Gammaproteobacteria bacterium]
MRTAVLVVFVVLLQACASTPERNPVPEELLPQVVVPGIPNARTTAPRTADEVEAMKDHFLVTAAELAAGVGTGPYSDFLAISGGGSEGAFGAGLLVGWSAAGTRPEFQVISGVSTGALIAPFVFAGPEYDDVLETFYTTTDTEDIMDRLGLVKILRGPALADTGPLRKIIATSIDDEFLAKVAAEHRKGRRLVIGTTNLDAQTPVVWNMGAIAESGQP